MPTRAERLARIIALKWEEYECGQARLTEYSRTPNPDTAGPGETIGKTAERQFLAARQKQDALLDEILRLETQLQGGLIDATSVVRG